MTVMKKFIASAVVSAAFFCGASAVSAQTLVPVERTDDGVAVEDNVAGLAAGEDVVTRSGRVLVRDGQKMSREETYLYVKDLCGIEEADRWNRSANIYGAGKGLLISSAVTIPVGAAVCGYGTVIFVANSVGGSIGAAISGSITGDGQFSPEIKNEIARGAVLMLSGAAVLSVGLGTLIAGAVCVPVGKGRMNGIVGRCNEACAPSRDITMNFGACRHGIGLTLNF